MTTSHAEFEAFEAYDFDGDARFCGRIDLAAFQAWAAAKKTATADPVDAAVAEEPQAAAQTEPAASPAAAPASLNPPYSLSFQEIAERVSRGEPIPGIRSIPDTVHGEGSVATLKPRRKPWETDGTADAAAPVAEGSPSVADGSADSALQ
ncbi:hypothetical protein BC831DRAFT_510842 [Entophlyctis helioformis]|nr:hypothetical protein BC831DRAFT_510842 [Entophlyctis helioformis]